MPVESDLTCQKEHVLCYAPCDHQRNGRNVSSWVPSSATTPSSMTTILSAPGVIKQCINIPKTHVITKSSMMKTLKKRRIVETKAMRLRYSKVCSFPTCQVRSLDFSQVVSHSLLPSLPFPSLPFLAFPPLRSSLLPSSLLTSSSPLICHSSCVRLL